MLPVIRTFTACCAIAMGLVCAAALADPQDVVVGGAKQPVRSQKFGTCVQTKWSAATDVCAPAQEPVKVEVAPPAAPEPVTQLESEQLTIYFPFNKSLVTAESASKLDHIADAVNRSPKVTKVDIVGYTDQIGSESYNDKLSVKRADAVKKYLDTKMRIPAGVLGLRGLGEKDPVTVGCGKVKARKKKIECMAKDRRVEIEFEFEK